ncbi:MAG: ABC transporter permease [Actinobacteria bacterium]|nr:ABC transporter permease [Actinomycetota bacterium]
MNKEKIGTARDGNINNTVKKKRSVLGIFYNLRILILIIIVIVLFSSMSKGFFSLNTLNSILSLMSAYGTIAIGQTIVILIGGLDVSVGYIMSISGLLLIKMMPYGVPVAVLICLLSGIFIGFLNGLIISRLRVNSLITTIGMGFLLGGVALLISDGTIHIKDNPIVDFGNGIFWYIPYIAIIYLALTALVQYILKRTTLGLKFYCVGADRLSCTFSGISNRNMELFAFILSGLFASLGGFIYSIKLAAASPLIGSDVPIFVITAVLLGGTTIGGGYGDVVKTLSGIFLITLITKGLTLLNVEAYFQNMIIGVILISLLFIGRKLTTKGRLFV